MNLDGPEHHPGSSTERQETVDAGFAELEGTDRKEVVKRVRDWIEIEWSVPNRTGPDGVGTAAEKQYQSYRNKGIVDLGDKMANNIRKTDIADKKHTRTSSLGTRAIHIGEPQYPGDPVTMPIYQSSTFLLDESAYDAIAAGRRDEKWVYTRWKNPTTSALEEKVASIEGCETAVATSSGMAAITATIFGLLKSGDHLVSSHDLYGGTFSLFNGLNARGISVAFVDQGNPEAVRKAVTKDTRLIYLESMTNPLLRMPELDDIAKIAKEHSIPVAVDNTFPTPVNLRPCEHGADIAIHSATKYLAGHSDLVAGIVAGSDSLIKKIRDTNILLGGTLDPHASFLVSRGLKTLHLRMERHNENGLAIARFLETHPGVKCISHPGLPCHPQHPLAKKLLEGFGGMVTFELKGAYEDALSFLNKLELFSQATSLGGVESLASMPVNTSHSHVPPQDRLKMGITDTMVRLSAGIEDVDDLIGDLDSALRNCNRG